MPPGDPILTVAAPADARLVTAYFPFGLVKDLHYDPFLGRWQTRFNPRKGREEWFFTDMTLASGFAYRFDGADPFPRLELHASGQKNPFKRMALKMANRRKIAFCRRAVAQAVTAAPLRTARWSERRH